MIVSRVRDGLGNQMFQYAAARALSVRLGDPDVVLAVGEDAKDNFRKFELDVFDLPMRFTNKIDRLRMALSFGTPSHPARRFARAVTPFVLLHVLHDEHTGYDVRFDTAKGNLYLIGHWQSEKYFTDVADTIRKDFTFRNEPSRPVKAMLDQINAANAVAIHVRRGDYAGDQRINRIHGVIGIDYYRTAFETLSQRVSNPHYFVFSDDPEWTRANLQVDGPATYVSGHSSVEDLRLLTACRHFIIPHSTFSWWGAWLSTAAGGEKVVIAPRHWFAKPHPSDPDKVPASWISIDVQPAVTL